MPRLTQLDDVLFPVDVLPVFAGIKTGYGERMISVPGKKAIVNTKSGRVLGVVSQGYRLVTNREALDMAYQCCRAVFPETTEGEWEAHATDAPETGGHCFIDLAHNSTALDFTFVPAKDRPDAFGPFIRVTNSYNGLRALAFEIGFYRKVCKNGMIALEFVIRFKFVHLQREIGNTIKFEIDHEKLAKLKASLKEYFGALRDFRVSRAQFEPLLSAVLLVRKPRHATPGTREGTDWEILQNHLTELCNRYVSELGENAYAAFNAITEFASHPPDNRCVYRERHSFQRLAGAWVTDFTRACREPEFDLEKYIDKLNHNNGNGSEPPNAAPDRQAAAYTRRT